MGFGLMMEVVPLRRIGRQVLLLIYVGSLQKAAAGWNRQPPPRSLERI
jgi:hypothetical protein